MPARVQPPSRLGGVRDNEERLCRQQGDYRVASSGTDLGFEAELFKAADKLRGNLEPSEYKHVALGLIFLKYVSDAFDIQHARLEQEEYADPEDPEEYLAERVFWVPPIARWANLNANARARDIPIVDPVTGAERKVDIGGLIDAAMEKLEGA
jgi:type I restriction enzyme M protein